MDKKEQQAQIALGTYLDNEWRLFVKARKRIDREYGIAARNNPSGRTSLKYKHAITLCRMKEATLELRWYTACREVHGENVDIYWPNPYECVINGNITYRRT
jgi:hypothetical protein